MKTAVIFTPLFVSSLLQAGNAARVDHRVHRKLQERGTVNLMVTMKESPRPILESFQAQESSSSSRGDTITRMVAKLEAHAQESQAEISKLMAQESSTPLASEMRSFWITNEVYFKDATIELVEKLSALDSVASIQEDPVYQSNLKLPEMGPVTNASSTHRSLETPGIDWGANKIQAPSVWAQGYTGQGVVVGSFDTGIRGSHEALRGSWRQEYGWLDPYNKTSFPQDTGGHGTYTLGGIVGANGVGIAPGAKWIACRGDNDFDHFTMSGVLACAEFFVCPTDPTGTKKDCSKAPHVINYSYTWMPGEEDRFLAMFKTWAAAKIIPVAAMGNWGPDCGKLYWPTNPKEAISVGSTGQTDALSSFSSRGPHPDGTIKPDISAPGESIRSSAFTSDTAYTTASGTSISAPIVTGTVALLLSKYPGLSLEEVRTALTSTAETETLTPTNTPCNGTVDGVYPNNMYGYGRVNALRALEFRTKCGGLSQKKCEGKLFCSWNAHQSHCQQWW